MNSRVRESQIKGPVRHIYAQTKPSLTLKRTDGMGTAAFSRLAEWTCTVLLYSLIGADKNLEAVKAVLFRAPTNTNGNTRDPTSLTTTRVLSFFPFFSYTDTRQHQT